MKLIFTETQMNKRTDMNLQLFKKGSHDWLILVVFILIGALIAFAFSFLKEPIYEATALVTSNLHLNKDGSVNEFMLDSQINHIGELYYNPNVVQKLIEREYENGIHIDLETLKEIATVERRMLNSLIKIRHKDPEVAADIASNWAEILYKTLEQAYPYALEASRAKDTLVLLENCDNTNSNPEYTIEIDAFCQSMTKSEYDQALATAKETVLQNDRNSLGLSEYLNVSQYQPAAIPAKPVSFHRGSMVLAGGVIGLLFAFMILIIRKQND